MTEKISAYSFFSHRKRAGNKKAENSKSGNYSSCFASEHSF